MLNKIKCPECCNSLLHNGDNSDLNHREFLSLKDFGGFKKPSDDGVSFCLLTEKYVREIAITSDGKNSSWGCKR